MYTGTLLRRSGRLGSFPFSQHYSLHREFASAAKRELVLRASASVIPHPEKADKGGEDAYFIVEGSAIGVADGVGGWAEFGIDPAVYSRSIMAEAKNAIEKKKMTDPVSVLSYAHQETNKNPQNLGSTTAVVALLLKEEDKFILKCANLGDSGMMVVRDGRVVLRTKSQQHRFNMPYQLSGETPSEKGEDADRYELEVSEGDTVLMATDGYFDNVFDEKTVAILAKGAAAAALATSSSMKGTALQNLADKLARLAHKEGSENRGESPFSVEANKAHKLFVGGKLDDVTVVVAQVVANELVDSVAAKTGNDSQLRAKL